LPLPSNAFERKKGVEKNGGMFTPAPSFSIFQNKTIYYKTMDKAGREEDLRYPCGRNKREPLNNPEWKF